jgi:RNA polymerase sigma-70 factor (ECF subfamily)
MTTERSDFLPTRRSLLSRLRNPDDNASWEDFFRTYSKLIHRVAIKAGLTESEAEEVVQETLITVSKKIPGFKYDSALGSFKGWLLQIVRWRIADQMRRRSPQEAGSRASTSETGSRRTRTVERLPDPRQIDLEVLWDEEWQRAALTAAGARVKAQVSPKQYQIFDLYVLKQWPVAKVSETLGVSATQVYLAKHRVSRLMTQELRKVQAGSL